MSPTDPPPSSEIFDPEKGFALTIFPERRGLPKKGSLHLGILMVPTMVRIKLTGIAAEKSQISINAATLPSKQRRSANRTHAARVVGSRSRQLERLQARPRVALTNMFCGEGASCRCARAITVEVLSQLGISGHS